MSLTLKIFLSAAIMVVAAIVLCGALTLAEFWIDTHG